MAFKKQRGIFDNISDPRMDADVIMTAAVVGHAYARLSKGKNCAFDVEAPVRKMEDNPTVKELIDDEVAIADVKAGFDLHVETVAKINKALSTMGGTYGVSGAGKEAIVGITPNYDRQGNITRITAGSGDLPLDSKYRYNPQLPPDLAGQKLYGMAFNALVGYQGRGAYTGFVSGRDGGQTNLFCTNRHAITDDTGPRWLPTDVTGISWDTQNPELPPVRVEIGTGPKQKIWGMLQTNAYQQKLAQAGMFFQDDSNVYGTPVLTIESIAGYTHGMIQAIYDVETWKLRFPGKKAGTPYEIAVGAETTKLASCFSCAIFMEANGYPASATHIGRGESWSPAYPLGTDAISRNACTHCNDQWAAYCKVIMDFGVRCLEGKVRADHGPSFAKLKVYTAGKNNLVYANMVLDALTVHDSETKRVSRTIA